MGHENNTRERKVGMRLRQNLFCLPHGALTQNACRDLPRGEPRFFSLESASNEFLGKNTFNKHFW